jgi:hypothetical protein
VRFRQRGHGAIVYSIKPSIETEDLAEALRNCHSPAEYPSDSAAYCHGDSRVGALTTHLSGLTLQGVQRLDWMDYLLAEAIRPRATVVAGWSGQPRGLR